jgi:Protein of unknown function (DUF2961)
MKNIAAIVALISGLALMNTHADTYTYPDLVKRLYDLEQLAARPPVGEKTGLASSYDRDSRYDAAEDKYIGWAANKDGVGVVRQEGDQSVLAEINGPGCIWRIWTATPGPGHVKIYLDGAPTPAVDMAFTDYFNGKSAPFNRPNLVYRTAANGFDSFIPIPFQKSCRIVADPKWGQYYHFNYTTFAPGTEVPTFKLPLSPADETALDVADKVMGNCGTDPAGKRPGEQTVTKKTTVQPGQAVAVFDIDGPAAITALKLHLDGIPEGVDEQTAFLRKLAIRIHWDRQKDPAVWSPLGDFFADAAGAASYLSLPTGLTQDGQWYSYWYMPFASHATVTVENDSSQPVTMTWEVVHAPLSRPIASLMRFHAKWHRDAFLPESKDRWPDWTLLTTTGTGRYVGTQLHIWNPAGGWWGEGDEKFFVDGEKFPSTIGTGSEDYFGYAWSSGKAFNQALHGQPVNVDNIGHISVHRWHIPDSVPFQKSFEGIIEKYYPNTRPTLFAAVAYWYLSPEGNDPYPAIPVADRIGYSIPVYREPDVIEGENMKVSSVEPMRGASPQGMINYGLNLWSGNAQMWWHSAAVGNKLALEFSVKETGIYSVVARFTKAPDYGIAQISIDGTKFEPPVDLFSSRIAPADPVALGTAQLSAGEHVLDMEITGKNEASKGWMLGFDYLKLVPEGK